MLRYWGSNSPFQQKMQFFCDFKCIFFTWNVKIHGNFDKIKHICTIFLLFRIYLALNKRSTYSHRVIRLRLYSQWVLNYFKNSVSLSTKQLWITPAFTSTVSLVLVRSSQIVLPQWMIPDWFSDEQVKRCTLWFRILYC